MKWYLSFETRIGKTVKSKAFLVCANTYVKSDSIRQIDKIWERRHDVIAAGNNDLHIGTNTRDSKGHSDPVIVMADDLNVAANIGA